MIRILGALGVVACLAPAAEAACSTYPLTISGVVKIVKTTHPNGTPITAYQVQSDRPISVDGIVSDGCVQASLVHLFVQSKSDRQWLKAHLGQTVTVTTSDIFEASTAWHIGDAVAMKPQIKR
jgi:hypothetical protein